MAAKIRGRSKVPAAVGAFGRVGARLPACCRLAAAALLLCAPSPARADVYLPNVTNLSSGGIPLSDLLSLPPSQVAHGLDGIDFDQFNVLPIPIDPGPFPRIDPARIGVGAVDLSANGSLQSGLRFFTPDLSGVASLRINFRAHLTLTGSGLFQPPCFRTRDSACCPVGRLRRGPF